MHVKGGAVAVDVAGAFRDPDGDPLTYEATSSEPAIASVAVSGSTVTITAGRAGTTKVATTATDRGGSNRTATQAFGVRVQGPSRLFTDHPIVPGVTPVKAVHFLEIRSRIDALRRATGLQPFAWTDPVLEVGATPVRLAHLLDLRMALVEAYASAGQSTPRWTDPVPVVGTTAIRSAHLMELRAAVLALE